MPARKPLDADRFLTEIADGSHDDRLAELVGGCFVRASAGPQSLRWKIVLDGMEWDQSSLTVGEQRFVQQTIAYKWVDGAIQDPEVFTAFVVAHLHKVEGVDLKEAIERAEGYSWDEALEGISYYQVDRPAPKDSAA